MYTVIEVRSGETVCAHVGGNMLAHTVSAESVGCEPVLFDEKVDAEAFVVRYLDGTGEDYRVVDPDEL